MAMGRTTNTPLAAQVDDLAGLARAARLRSLSLPGGTDFSSNDYLALAGSGRLKNAVMDALERGVPVGSGGSR
ncbi:MAG TPA: 8-amino-7-oxononanoate synthase, partial [Erythrobacter sp.]|nr:8-amino-7-oxononanoate synthase [Erythrobacter sp.]